MTTKNDTATSQPVIITLTLPEPDHEWHAAHPARRSGAPAPVCLHDRDGFHAPDPAGTGALVGIENNPPIIPDEPPRKTA